MKQTHPVCASFIATLALAHTKEYRQGSSMSDPLIITNSLILTFKTCQKKAQYKYIDLLIPKRVSAKDKPLSRGTWFHALLEAKYGKGNVNEVHRKFCSDYRKLFDEEKDALGDLPVEMAQLYKAYSWHYRSDNGFKVHEVELKLEADLPNGMQGQGKADALVEDPDGDLWVLDHKTHQRLPGWSYRTLDPQSAFYIWLFHMNDIPVRGFIWNYVVPTPPQPLKFKIAGGLYKRQSPVLDYPTAYSSAEAEGRLDDVDVQTLLAELKNRRYDRNSPQTSPVFQRDFIEKEPDTIERMIDDLVVSAERYDYLKNDVLVHDPKATVERTVGRHCEWCDFKTLCEAELLGMNAEGVRKREFKHHDPLEYYKTETDTESVEP